MAKKVEVFESIDGKIFKTEAEAVKQDAYLTNLSTFETNLTTLKSNLNALFALANTENYTLTSANEAIEQINNWLNDNITSMNKILK